MRDPEITDEEIIAAGQRLESRGRKVTKTSLRSEAGGGNSERVLEVWLSHKDECERRRRALSDLPPESDHVISGALERINSEVRNVMAAVRTSVQDVANRPSADAGSGCVQRVREAQEDLAAAEKQIDMLDIQVRENSRGVRHCSNRHHHPSQSRRSKAS